MTDDERNKMLTWTAVNFYIDGKFTGASCGGYAALRVWENIHAGYPEGTITIEAALHT